MLFHFVFFFFFKFNLLLLSLALSFCLNILLFRGPLYVYTTYYFILYHHLRLTYSVVQELETEISFNMYWVSGYAFGQYRIETLPGTGLNVPSNVAILTKYSSLL